MPTKYRLTFKDVGRNKKCWTVDFKSEPTDAQIVKEVRKSGALMSSSIDADFVTETTGRIYVGGFRCVGGFTVLEIKPCEEKALAA